MSVLPCVAAARQSLLRPLLRHTLHRSMRPPSPFPSPLRPYSSFIPPEQYAGLRPSGSIHQEHQFDEFSDDGIPYNEEDVADTDIPQSELNKDYPQSPNFYTSRSQYFDSILQLEKGVREVQTALKGVSLHPLPKFARESLPPKQRFRWMPMSEMGDYVGTTLSVTRYNRITALLNQLADYHNIASTAGVSLLAKNIMDILNIFRSHSDLNHAPGERKNTTLDQYGRSYTVGKRKSSAARVWMIPAREPSQSKSVSDSPEALLGLESTFPPTHIPVTNVLINNIPLNEYFPIPADRERVLYPLKVAGLLGKYNIFALTRGGGTTGQSGALAHGIAKALVIHDPHAGKLIRRLKLAKRDPRAVERKKTGQPKARKRYTWVKR